MIVCFCHLIRTAGTTLHHIFRNNYGMNHVEVQKRNFSPEDLKRLLRFNKRIKVMGGHYLRTTTGLTSAYPELTYITFLRDPVDRFLSHYNHGWNRGHHRMSIEERVQVRGEADYQVKFFLGCQTMKDRDFPVSREDLEKAKKILADDYAFVGIAEKFDESLVLLKEKLGWHDLDIRYEKMHATKKKQVTKQDLSPDLLRSIKEANRMDEALYRFAVDELFARQVEAYPGHLNQAVEDFRRDNRDFRFRRSALIKYRMVKYLVYKPYFKLASHT